jgi:hypothetical protein
MQNAECRRAWLLALACVAWALPTIGLGAEPKPAVIVVVGAEGDADFGQQFRTWAGRWEAAAKKGGAELTTIGLSESTTKGDRDVLAERLTELSKTPSKESVWLILLGHGTFDGKTARFNLRGDDFTPAELATWLEPLQRPLAMLNCASGSGAFLPELSGKDRIVITATKSGQEYNFARFGDYISAAIGDTKADLDKDGQTSLLEAYLMASGGVNEFYKSEARLATEHALLDDNGDKLGTPADFFQGVRAVKSAKSGAAPDGLLAGQFALIRSASEEQLPAEIRARRDDLERNLAALRLKRPQLPEAEYFAQLEPLLIELSKLYETGGTTPPANDSP